MWHRTKLIALLAAGVALGTVVGGRTGTPAGAQEKKGSPDPAAVERTRETVKLIDALYKNYVIEITSTYVGEKKQPPAARVTQRVFQAMHKGNFHSARLVDATGEPVNEENRPKTAFEKKAIELIKGGKGYYDEVATAGGKDVLRAATVVPVVMQQCITCHPGHKVGDVLGAIVYEVPIR